MTPSSSKTTSPRTEAGRALADKPYKLWTVADIAAIEAEAAEPYRRVVEAARVLLRAMPRTEDGKLVWQELRHALAALPVSEAERD